MAEFLPLCDVLFNVISLAGYFCDVVFDLVLGYALFKSGKFSYFATVIGLVGFSLIISQFISLRWYLNKSKKLSLNDLDKNIKTLPTATSSTSKIGRMAIISLHVTQMGVLWRYAKLFVPVDLRHVKHEVRDLCMLRLVHAFCEAAPMLLLQLHVLVGLQYGSELNTPETKLKSLGPATDLGVGVGLTPTYIHQSTVNQQYQERTFKDLNVVSAVLSLFSVCWALASFSKNVRLQNVHRLVLTWLGVIFQFFWRLGTVTSRVISLTVYASFYNEWVFLVIILHWFSMFLWLISPKNVFHGEKISRLRKSVLAGMIAFVYVFAYINLQEVNHRQKMITFYVVMFLENCLLVCLWMVGIWSIRTDRWFIVPITVLATFMAGMFFMVVYYRYFHIRRLHYEAGGRIPSSDCNKCYQCGNSCKCMDQNDVQRCFAKVGGLSIGGNLDEIKYCHIPGVFNCRFSNPVGNGATKRKKKKPTSFIPPPTLSGLTPYTNTQLSDGPVAIPFWRRPLPRSQAGSSENEGSVESRVNIHQKLQEKKQKQLAELKIIEEEIKQGKLGGPAMGTLSSGDDGKASLPRQPIPRVKKHIDLEPIDWCSTAGGGIGMGDGSPSFSDLNILSIPNLDDKYNSCNYGVNGLNLAGLQSSGKDNSARNMSPISSQMSGGESNSLTKQNHHLRSKIPHNIATICNSFGDNYCNHLNNVYGDSSNGVNGNGTHGLSISPRNTTGKSSPGNRNNLYHGGLYLEVNHPRQISGTYSSSVENSEHLPFPYNVIPPPRSKIDSRLTPTTPFTNQQNNLNSSKKRQIQRSKTPEILLAPHFLENSRIYYDWVTRDPSIYNRSGQDSDRNHGISSGDENLDVSAADESVSGIGQNCNRVPSDIDSQVSLPRSYTLPREFKYYRRNKSRKTIKNEHFIASTNSSDGDVDSCDDNESEHHSNLSNPNTNNYDLHCQPQQNHQTSRHNNDLNSSSNSSNNYHNHMQSTNYHMPPNYRQGMSPSIQYQIQQQHIINMNGGEINNLNRGSGAVVNGVVVGGGLGVIGVGGGGMSGGICNGGGGSGSSDGNTDFSQPKAVNNLDLINGVDNSVMNRMRMRVYGAGKTGMVRHETKL